MTRPDTDNYLEIFLNNIPMIDTRAPAEFARGAFDNAVNLPLMSDEERHLVGTRYKQQGQDAAIALGRELVGAELQQQRTAQWLAFAQANPEGYLYCFRGGLRSRITQSWIAEAGLHYPYIKGGYKAMRRFLIERLEQDVAATPLLLISGRTGTGKTILLNQFQRSLDLEAMANHRGSSFGPMVEPQPTPITFENRLAAGVLGLTHQNSVEPMLLEGEGRLVGRATLPQHLWDQMCSSPTLILESSLSRRIDLGIADYVVDLLDRLAAINDPDLAFELFAARHRESLSRIQRRLGPERYKQASGMLESALVDHQNNQSLEGYRPFIGLLLEQYYDPMYDYQMSQRSAPVLAQGDEEELTHWLVSNGFTLRSHKTVNK